MRAIALTVSVLTTFLSGCGGDKSLSEQANDFGGRGINNANTQLQPVTDLLDLSPPPPNPERNAYFGDLHVHTEWTIAVTCIETLFFEAVINCRRFPFLA